jgi:hypothetical protein
MKQVDSSYGENVSQNEKNNGNYRFHLYILNLHKHKRAKYWISYCSADQHNF